MTIYALTFSPTGTSARVLKGIASGVSETLGADVRYRDLTLESPGEMRFAADDLVIVSAPVYGGKIAPVVKQRLAGISGEGAGCVVVAVYGNRAFENAPGDMASFMSDHGFRVCGAAAFVGEHSYSTPATPIAQGRPDRQDIADARRFGEEIAERISGGTLCEVDVRALEDVPSPAESMKNFREFVMEYQRRQAESPVKLVPQFDATLCDDCGSCYSVCPTEAITADSHEVDAAKCIKCCACVKVCPQNARIFHSPFSRPLSENFKARKDPKWIL